MPAASSESVAPPPFWSTTGKPPPRSTFRNTVSGGRMSVTRMPPSSTGTTEGLVIVTVYSAMAPGNA